MKRILSLALAVVLVFGMLVLPIQAANADSQAGVIKAVGGLNVRTEPTTGSKVLTTLSNGSYITLMSKSGSWWRVEYGSGRYGYFHADYITTVSGNTATVNTDPSGLNVRSGPGTDYKRGGILRKGDQVEISATGYDSSGAETATVRMTLARKGQYIKQWTSWNLSALGPVVKVRFNIEGGPMTEWGMTTPKYFAIDNIAIEH